MPVPTFICVILVLLNAIAEAPERVEEVSLDSLYSMIKEQGAVHSFYRIYLLTWSSTIAQRIRNLEDDNRNLNNTLQSHLEEFNNLRTSLGRAVRPFTC